MPHNQDLAQALPLWRYLGRLFLAGNSAASLVATIVWLLATIGAPIAVARDAGPAWLITLVAALAVFLVVGLAAYREREKLRAALVVAHKELAAEKEKPREWTDADFSRLHKTMNHLEREWSKLGNEVKSLMPHNANILREQHNGWADIKARTEALIKKTRIVENSLHSTPKLAIGYSVDSVEGFMNGTKDGSPGIPALAAQRVAQALLRAVPETKRETIDHESDPARLEQVLPTPANACDPRP